MQRNTEAEIHFTGYEQMQEIGERMRIEEYITLENVIPVIRSKQILEDLPENIVYVNKEDLAVLFQIKPPGNFKSYVEPVYVIEERMRVWGINTQQLYETAVKNMQEKSETKVYTLESVGAFMYEGEEKKEVSKEVWEQVKIPFLVITNADYNNGAAEILDTDKLQEISEIVEEDFYILPASIHECLLVPKSKIDLQEAKEMLMGVNREGILPEELLSDNVYEYSATIKEVTVARSDIRKTDCVEHIPTR